MSRYRDIGSAILAYAALNMAAVDIAEAQKTHPYTVGDLLHNMVDGGMGAARDGVTIGNSTFKFNKKLTDNIITPFKEWLALHPNIKKGYIPGNHNYKSLEGEINRDVYEKIAGNNPERNDRFNKYFPMAYSIGRKYKMPDALDMDIYMCIMRQESDFKPRAYNPESEATGLMQILPQTGDQVEPGITKSELFDPEKNMDIAWKYLLYIDDVLSSYHVVKGTKVANVPGYDSLDKKEKQRLIMASYFAGPGAVAGVQGDISDLSRDTRKYVADVDSWLHPG